MTTVLQLTDLHVEPAGTLAYGKADTASLVRSIRPWLLRFAPKVDLIVVTGDIACDGKPEAYEIVAQTLADLPVPVRVLPGNHDRRSNLVRLFPDFVEADAGKDAVEFTIERDDALVVGLDTLQPGRNWGALSDASLARLEAALADGRPVLTLMHHTPVHSGMGKMDEPFGNRGRLKEILSRRPDVRLATGHMHRGLVTRFGDTIVTTAPSVSLPIEIHIGPEGGDDFLFETPGFALHHLMPEGWVTYFGLIPVRTDFAGPFPFHGAVNPTDEE